MILILWRWSKITEVLNIIVSKLIACRLKLIFSNCIIKKRFLIFIPALLLAFHSVAQQLLPYKNPNLSINVRVKDLVGRMTVEEKFWQLFMIPGDLDHADSNQYKNGIFGLQVSATTDDKNAAQQMLHYNSSESGLMLLRKINSIQRYFIEHTRLGIPIIAFDEALHGLVRGGATSFPQSIALAATFDTSLMRNVATAIAEETKARGIRQVLSPVINIASDVRWGRVEETYGEDPFLTSEMGVAFVSPFERLGIITTPKHLIANSGDGGRDSYPIHLNERYLDEIHFPPFKACFQRCGTRSVMTCYNSLDGTPCTQNNWLLTKKLKEEMNFKGFVISDAGATGGANVLHYTSPDYPTSGADAINSGLDVIFQTAYEHYKLFIPPFLEGRINKKRLDDAVSRVLRAKFEIGLFDDPYISEEKIKSLQNNSAHKLIAKKAAEESIVLLKNKNVLPLHEVDSIAVIGVDATEARLGGYSGEGNNKVSILDGLKERAGKNIAINYTAGCGRKTDEWKVVPAEFLSVEKNKEGLNGEYFNNITLSGKPVLTRTDKSVDFHWTLFAPDPALAENFYSVRWEGTIHTPETGKYKIGLDGNDGFRLFINDGLLIDNWKKQTYSTLLADYYFEKNKSYKIRIEFYETVGNAHIRLIWNVGVTDDWKNKINDAVASARKSDVAVVVVGIIEGEFQDRAMLTLPGHQEEMINAIAETDKPVVVIIIGGSAVVMNNWIDHVDAILNAWYPGEEGGHAVASVLFGDYNPAGRLPITFPIDESQLPLVYNHKPTGRSDDYNNLTGLPLFPFGFGLSYTNFEYSNIHLDKNNISKNDSTVLKCTVKNSGNYDGDEVAQLYIRDLLASVARPVMELKGFQRVNLKAGESKEVKFQITPELLSMLNDKMETVVEPGDFKLMIGASSRDIRLIEMLTVK